MPLCIGGIHFFLFCFLALVCIFARSYWDCVSPDLRILFDVAQHNSLLFLFFSESLTHLFIDLLWFIPSVAFLAAFISSRKIRNHAQPHNVPALHRSLVIASGKAIFSLYEGLFLRALEGLKAGNYTFSALLPAKNQSDSPPSLCITDF